MQVVQIQLPPTAQLVRDIAQREVEGLSLLCLQSQAPLYKVIYKKLSVGPLKRIVCVLFRFGCFAGGDGDKMWIRLITRRKFHGSRFFSCRISWKGAGLSNQHATTPDVTVTLLLNILKYYL